MWRNIMDEATTAFLAPRKVKGNQRAEAALIKHFVCQTVISM
jgi:hypothetical protein